MAFQPAPLCAEVILDFIMNGKATANVLNFRAAGGYTQADLDNLAAAVGGSAGSSFVPIFTLTQQYIGCRVKGLAVQNDLISSSSDGAGTGENTEVALPNNVSLCVTLKTAVTGRSARGRFFMQPPNAGDMVGPNQVSTTYANAIKDALYAMNTAATGQGWTGIVLSRFANKVVRAEAMPFEILSFVVRNTRTDSQRNRMPVPD